MWGGEDWDGGKEGGREGYLEMVLKTSTMPPYTIYHSFQARLYSVSGMKPCFSTPSVASKDWLQKLAPTSAVIA